MNSELDNILALGTENDVRAWYQALPKLAKNNQFSLFEHEYIIFDTETTGLEVEKESLIEIAAAHICGTKVIDTFQTFVNPGKKIPEEIEELTSISNDMVKDAPDSSLAVEQFSEFVQGRDLIAHNIDFDKKFIMKYASAHDFPGSWIDSLALSTIVFPHLKGHRVKDLALAFGIQPGTHRADADVEALVQIWAILVAAIYTLKPGLACKLSEISPNTKWSLRSLFADAAAAQPGIYFDLRKHRRERVYGRKNNQSSAVSHGDMFDKRASKTGDYIDQPEQRPTQRVMQSSFQPAQHATQTTQLQADSKQQSAQPERCSSQQLKQQRVCSVQQAPQQHDAHMRHATAPSFPNDDEIRSAFTEDGIMGKLFNNYEQRHEQTQMALHVAHCLRDEEFGVIEAGTGVGKSLAYLIPAAMVSKQNEMTIGISTKTNALLDQLTYKDLPQLSKVLGGLNYIALKGYNNYPCMRKMDHYARNDHSLTVPAIEMLATLYVYCSQATWGDLDSISLYWPKLPRSIIESNPEDCLKQKCPYFKTCFLHGARMAAQKANIVVTNHSLLFRDAEARGAGSGPGLLPAIDNWIIDEAHAVEDEARKQFSSGVDARGLMFQLDRLVRTHTGIISPIEKRADTLEGGDILFAPCAEIKEKCEAVRMQSENFFTMLKDLISLSGQNNSYRYVTLWINERVRASSLFKRRKQVAAGLLETLSGLIKTLRDLISLSENFDELMAQRAQLVSSLTALQGMAEGLDLVMSGGDASYVYSAELNANPDIVTEALVAAKLDIGKKLQYIFYPFQRSIVFTSATLATGKNKDAFDYFKHSCGLDLNVEHSIKTLQLSSHFDYENNMRVLRVTNIHDPNSAAYIDDLEDLLVDIHVAMKGSVLTLFTNRSHLKDLYFRVKPRLKEHGLELAGQIAAGGTKALRESFIEKKELSLFATKSFWEGFDAPGDTLRCVVIVRIPFSNPHDPLMCERSERESQAWKKYSLPKAVTELKQAAGRLIRSENDSGWLVLADSRLKKMWYGAKFMNAMPTSQIYDVHMNEIKHVMCQEHYE